MRNDLKIVIKDIDELIPYENNPRINENAVEPVSKSIKYYGYKVPIVIDSNGVIIAGHTRLRALKKLGIKEVPVVIADDLTDEQVKAFRLIDNKTSEFAKWDEDKLQTELEKLEGLADEFDFVRLEDFDWDSVDDLSDDNYEEPEKTYVTCPYCGHTDTRAHFIAVKKDKEGD